MTNGITSDEMVILAEMFLVKTKFVELLKLYEIEIEPILVDALFDTVAMAGFVDPKYRAVYNRIDKIYIGYSARETSKL